MLPFFPSRALLLALSCTLLVASCSKAPLPFRSTALEGVKWGKDFELTAHTGQPLRTVDYRGKVLVLFFGYTHCPDICAPTLAKLAQLNRALGADAQRVQVLYRVEEGAFVRGVGVTGDAEETKCLPMQKHDGNI